MQSPCQCKWISREQMLIPACHRASEGTETKPQGQPESPHGSDSAPRFPPQSFLKRINMNRAPGDEGTESGPVLLLLKSVRKFPFMAMKSGLCFVFAISQASPSFPRELRSLSCSFGFNTKNQNSLWPPGLKVNSLLTPFLVLFSPKDEQTC